ncbi:MAG: hypothetical protein M3680_26160, partial [Myxococcota bacterium]|nr:hypothetical protein [Myxococcota bacterium]
FSIDATSVGPLTARTPATLGALRAALPGYDVVPIQQEGLEYRVSRAGEKLFDVVPEPDGSLLGVHVVSPRIAIAGRTAGGTARPAWQIGAPFPGVGAGMICECWGARPVCFEAGDHVAVAIDKPCRVPSISTAGGRQALAGARIEVAIWSPRPLAAGGAATDDAGEPDHHDDGDEGGPDADAP